ncbi:unnamed protein product [Larinioides sclopetarius]|uniref:Uncharacterized protein n=1 Tax=Larinioides sclopetarius TaxID=280406 RepID=A0AAV2A6L5_9ARAC
MKFSTFFRCKKWVTCQNNIWILFLELYKTHKCCLNGMCK